MNIQLKNIKVNLAFSEETTCFTADLFVNGKKAGYCKNDGHGGCTFYSAYDVRGRGLIALAEAWALEQKPTYVVMGDRGYTIESNLENWIDERVNDYLQKKENDKFAKKLQKNMSKGLCYGTLESYKIISWKDVTIEQLLNSNEGCITLRKKINELVNQGEIILNTNLPKDNFGNYLF